MAQRAAAAVGSPLLVVGSRGLGGFRSMLLGSVSPDLRPARTLPGHRGPSGT